MDVEIERWLVHEQEPHTSLQKTRDANGAENQGNRAKHGEVQSQGRLGTEGQMHMSHMCDDCKC
jgi:hypothetical protein